MQFAALRDAISICVDPDSERDKYGVISIDPLIAVQVEGVEGFVAVGATLPSGKGV